MPATVLVEGLLNKRGRVVAGISIWKWRYFRLTDDTLEWQDKQRKDVRGSVAIEEIISVTRIASKRFHRHRFAIQFLTSPAFECSALTVEEADTWIDALNSIIKVNNHARKKERTAWQSRMNRMKRRLHKKEPALDAQIEENLAGGAGVGSGELSKVGVATVTSIQRLSSKKSPRPAGNGSTAIVSGSSTEGELSDSDATEADDDESIDDDELRDTVDVNDMEQQSGRFRHAANALGHRSGWKSKVDRRILQRLSGGDSQSNSKSLKPLRAVTDSEFRRGVAIIGGIVTLLLLILAAGHTGHTLTELVQLVMRLISAATHTRALQPLTLPLYRMTSKGLLLFAPAATIAADHTRHTWIAAIAATASLLIAIDHTQLAVQE